jgi:hypothetical protein
MQLGGYVTARNTFDNTQPLKGIAMLTQFAWSSTLVEAIACLLDNLLAFVSRFDVQGCSDLDE